LAWVTVLLSLSSKAAAFSWTTVVSLLVAGVRRPAEASESLADSAAPVEMRLC